MRWSAGLIAPLALFELGCSSWLRAGPEVRAVDGRLAIGGKATVEGGIEQLLFPLALSAGATSEEGQTVVSLEAGGEYLGSLDERWGYVAGPRLGGMLAGPSGSFGGLSGGPFVSLDPEAGAAQTVLSLELFAGSGLGGDIRGGFVGGATLSLGTLNVGRFTVPSGRVLRGHGHAVTAGAIEVDAPNATWTRALSPPGCDRREAGAQWLRQALDEHAAISAFVLLARELRQLRAPASLVRGALRAAADEVRHARACFAIASAYLDRPLGPGPLPSLRPHTERKHDDVAREAVTDGCFGEGVAAQLARLRAAATPDPVLRRVLGSIARDEARHAELGWQTLAWCLRVGGNSTRAVARHALSSCASIDTQSPDVLERAALDTTARDLGERARALLAS